MPPQRDPAPAAIRLAILDDNPFVRSPDGTVRPRAALFHRFAETVVARGPFGVADYLIPVAAEPADGRRAALDAVDEAHLRIVATAPFHGIAGYLSHGPVVVTRNWPVIRRAVRRADLVWIKAPASNASLAALACRRGGVPRFTWVAGSVGSVVAGQPGRGVGRRMAMLAARAYDGVTGLLVRTGPSIELDDELFTSVITAADVAATVRAPKHEEPAALGTRDRPLRLVTAARLTADKGIDDLVVAAGSLRRNGLAIRLAILGDGPARSGLEVRAAGLGMTGDIEWRGFVADRSAYLDALRNADLFVLPSHAEGVPKVLVEAMAAGVPTVATDVGAVRRLLADGNRGDLVASGRPDALADAILRLAADRDRRQALRSAGLAFAADHTIEAQADRLIAWLQATFPQLAWPAPG